MRHFFPFGSLALCLMAIIIPSSTSTDPREVCSKKKKNQPRFCLSVDKQKFMQGEDPQAIEVTYEADEDLNPENQNKRIVIVLGEKYKKGNIIARKQLKRGELRDGKAMASFNVNNVLQAAGMQDGWYSIFFTSDSKDIIRLNVNIVRKTDEPTNEPIVGPTASPPSAPTPESKCPLPPSDMSCLTLVIPVTCSNGEYYNCKYSNMSCAKIHGFDEKDCVDENGNPVTANPTTSPYTADPTANPIGTPTYSPTESPTETLQPSEVTSAAPTIFTVCPDTPSGMECTTVSNPVTCSNGEYNNCKYSNIACAYNHGFGVGDCVDDNDKPVTDNPTTSPYTADPTANPIRTPTYSPVPTVAPPSDNTCPDTPSDMDCTAEWDPVICSNENFNDCKYKNFGCAQIHGFTTEDCVSDNDNPVSTPTISPHNAGPTANTIHPTAEPSRIPSPFPSGAPSISNSPSHYCEARGGTQVPYVLTIQADSNPRENSFKLWVIKNGAWLLKVNRSRLKKGLNVYERCLFYKRCYKLELFDSENDGISGGYFEIVFDGEREVRSSFNGGKKVVYFGGENCDRDLSLVGPVKEEKGNK